MKKYLKIILPLVIIVCLVSIVLILINAKSEKKYDDYIDNPEFMYDYTNIDDDLVDSSWYIENQDVGRIVDVYNTYNIDSIDIDASIEQCPEWIQDEYTFYPEDAETDIIAYTVLYEAGYSIIEKSDKKSKYLIEGSDTRLYNVDGIDKVVVRMGRTFCVYNLSDEK